MGKRYTTNFLEDTNGSTGTTNQVLVSTATGIDWVDGSGSGIIGGPYLPLSGGTLTGDLSISGGNGGQLLITSGNVAWDASIDLDTGDSNGQWRIKAEGSDETFHITNVDQGGASAFTLHPTTKNATFAGANTYNKIQSYYSGSYISGWKFSDYNGGIWYDAGSDDLTLNAGHANSQMLLNSGGAIALTLDSSQNATFAGNINLPTTKYLRFTSASSNSDATVLFGNTSGTGGSLTFKRNSDSAAILTLNGDKSATFAGKVITTEVESASTILLDAAADITIDAGGGDIILSDDGTIFGTFSKSGNDLQLRSRISDGDLLLRGVDGGVTIDALKLDMSAGGNATFAAQAFATTATSSGDGSSTLTTKGYVDGLITGATIYRGAWDPSGGGYGSPDLSGVTQTSGYYYICSAAGTAEPNGTGTEPDSWAVGDWVIYNDVSGTGQWQKIDNSSVLSGVGTGQTVALWEGAGSVTDSETLGNAPITVSGNDTTFGGSIITTSSSGVIQTPKISMEADGTLDWGGARDYGTLTWDTGYALIRGQSGKGIKFGTNGSTVALTLDTSQNATFAGDVIIPTTKALYFDGGGGTYIYESADGVMDFYCDTKQLLTLKQNGTQNEVVVNEGSIDVDFRVESNNDTAALFVQGSDGNVGIGTTAPNESLHVHKDATPRIILTDGTTGTTSGSDGMFLGIAGDQGFNIWNYENTYTRFAVNNSEAMRITSAGDVGIGTTAPSGKLTIVAPDVTTGPAITLRQTNAATQGWDFDIENNTIGRLDISGVGAGGKIQAISMLKASGNVGIGTASPSHKLEVGLTSGVSLASQPAIPLMISNDGNSVDGRVLLQVKHDAVNTAGAIAAGYQMTAAAVTSGTASYYNSLIFLESAGSGSETVHSAPKNIEFYTNNFAGAAGSGTSYTDLGNLAFELQADGDAIFYDNVGIGTTSPGAKLDVTTDHSAQTAIRVTHNNYNDYVLLKRRSDDTQKFGIKGENSDGSMGLATNNTTRMTISSGGNVGIGTTAPSAKLDVVVSDVSVTPNAESSAVFRRNGNNYITILSNSSNEGGILFGNSTDDNDASISYGHNTQAMSFATADAERMRITSAGNVGIGTTAPGEKLQVNSGNIKIEGGAASSIRGLIIAHTGQTGNQTLLVQNSTNSFGHLYTTERALRIEAGADGGTGTGETLDFWVNGSERMMIDTTGNVGIGTTAPDSPLEVQFDEATGTAKQMLHIDYNSTNNYGSGYLKISAGGSSQALTFIEQVTSGGNGLFGTYIDTNIINKGLSASTHGNINFVTGSSTSASSIVMTIGGGSQKGNVGIGVTAPTSNLHIGGTEPSNGVSLAITTGTDDIGLRASSTRLDIVSSTATVWRQLQAGSFVGNVNEISSFAGNVGIGTTAPGAKLDIVGDGTNYALEVNNTSTGDAIKINTANATGNNGIYWDQGNVNLFNLFSNSSNDTRLRLSNTAGIKIHLSTNGDSYFTGGGVGIATTSPGTAYSLVVATIVGQTGSIEGQGSIKITSGALGVNVTPSGTAGRIDASNDIVAYSSSDERLKENITPITDATEKVKKLTGIEFDWKEEFKDAHGHEGRDTGVIAQQVLEVMPTAVRENDNGYLAVRYEKLIGLLIESNKELAARTERLEGLVELMLK